MKKVLNLTSVYLILLVALSSCSYHVGTISAGSATITDKNFSHIDFAYGTARTANVLGIGSNKKDALVLEAKRSLYLNYDLQPGQALGQTTVDFKRTFFFPILVTKVTLSAEVLDFNTENQDYERTKSNLERFTGTPQQRFYKFGEYVNYNKKNNLTIDAQVVGRKDNYFVIRYIDENNNMKFKKVDALKLSAKPENASSSTKYSGKLLTPKSPEKELVKFKYEDKEYTGELMETSGSNYLIRMQTNTGELIGIYVNEKDVIK
ncbi:DUF6567 family protein [Chondrinema litorale]|uniref:DUF6567 family protein n=1 Tax=Chondrinema litorale TaxID=2994555 RepID=UPI0025429D8A|nr:DUF6567 family protein [Chondrinema litorale]UZR98859.1 hypothetical protein OQ292_33240 [Chondrinema litorale]